ncbi:hypothetical protein KIN20_004698 [Parelaphostrongylus tenuis]|uniref:Uncharacterized protein n=1 Tax=Parelaphostrongylus tenuis TaxID=148309 RepID=A0AAD5QI60_PARTN|nr:hypothetical protein KIN20_004698 [Parelaphostrongylus tenuis]
MPRFCWTSVVDESDLCAALYALRAGVRLSVVDDVVVVVAGVEFKSQYEHFADVSATSFSSEPGRILYYYLSESVTK